jgi:hypothetical protein
MAENKEIEKKDVTGLDQAADRKEAEYDLVKALLESAEYKTSEEEVTEVEIKRGGKFLFSVHIHPISEPDARTARKKATTYMPNPNGRKLPPIEKELDTAKFNSWLIYLATTEADQQKIWGNGAIMKKYDLAQPVESIDVLLTLGEKRKLADLVTDISGMDDDEEENVDEEEYAKN